MRLMLEVLMGKPVIESIVRTERGSMGVVTGFSCPYGWWHGSLLEAQIGHAKTSFPPTDKAWGCIRIGGIKPVFSESLDDL